MTWTVKFQQDTENEFIGTAMVMLGEQLVLTRRLDLADKADVDSFITECTAKQKNASDSLSKVASLVADIESRLNGGVAVVATTESGKNNK